MARATTHRSGSARRRGQEGFILIAVITLMGFFAVVGLALLAMTGTAGKVSTGLSASTAAQRRIDGALEHAVDTLRSEPEWLNTSCATYSSTYRPDASKPGISVTCAGSTGNDVADFTPLQRNIDLTAAIGVGTVGRARIRFLDQSNGVVSQGLRMLVCDWQLGTTDVNEDLETCP